jgi:hypothetical protein
MLIQNCSPLKNKNRFTLFLSLVPYSIVQAQESTEMAAAFLEPEGEKAIHEIVLAAIIDQNPQKRF